MTPCDAVPGARGYNTGSRRPGRRDPGLTPGESATSKHQVTREKLMADPGWPPVVKTPGGRRPAGKGIGRGAARKPAEDNVRVIGPPVIGQKPTEKPESRKVVQAGKPAGFFVTFEGCEGAGKTTQSEMLKDYLLAHGHDVVLTREPGGTVVGEKIREILLNPGNREISPVTEALLFAANRAQVVQEVIKPALDKDWIVIGDRFVDSSLAYQGVGRGLGLEAVNNLNEWATAGLEPALTVYLDIPYTESMERIARSTPDRIEAEPREFHENVRQAYGLLARIYPQRVLVLDARDSAEAVHARVVSSVGKLIRV